ncbi:MAG TPA: MbnP family protein [Candidatus Krumholzibacteria bacterium]
MKFRILALCLPALLALGGCGGDDTSTPETPGEVEVVFNLNVGGTPLQPLSTDATTYTSPSGTKYGISGLRFVISDVRLHSDTGKDVTLASVHYFDFDVAATRTIQASAPHENYTGMSFTFGLDAGKNLRDKYPITVIPDVMFWPLDLGADLGYHYMQIEGNYEKTGGGTGPYTTHTGGRHLDGTSLAYPGVVDATAYHFNFPVNLSFTPAHIHEGGHGLVVISFDLNGWYMDHTPADGVDTQYDFNSLANQMIMGNLDAQGKLRTNGPGCFTATMTVHGGQDD